MNSPIAQTEFETGTGLPRLTFTLTAGRTGSAWLADFMKANSTCETVHEPLGIDDFGVTMPDIRLMRTFNCRGNNDYVQEFWRNRFELLPSGNYVESNHTLGKCGLIENIVNTPLADETAIVILRRRPAKQIASYVQRHDFGNVTLLWQWYLDPNYSKTLVSIDGFKGAGPLALPIWYYFEMTARQAYYRRKFEGQIKFVDIELETVTKPEGAKVFWDDLGGKGRCTLPPPANKSKGDQIPGLLEQLEGYLDKINFDADELAEYSIKKGFSFDAD